MITPRNLLFALLLVCSSASLCNAQEQSAPVPPTSDAPVTTANGTAGRVAKFTTATNIANSIITENSGKLGVSVTAPTAVLHINGVQPTGDGANANALLRTTGGKGGDAVSSSKGGTGASIVLAAGDGGDAQASGFSGNGGSITLQPGSQGTGGDLGQNGNVIIAPTVGSVLVGPASPINGKLVVKSTFTAAIYGESGSGGVVGISSGNEGVYGGSTNGVGVSGNSSGGQGVYGSSTNNAGVEGFSPNGYGVKGFSNGSSKAGVFGSSASSYGVQGETFTGTAVLGKASGSGTGVTGYSTSGKGVTGHSDSNVGVSGTSFTGDAVKGQSNSGYAGNFLGKSRFSGNMEIAGNELFGNTTRQMINLYNLDYGIGIQAATLYFRVANTGGYNWYMGGAHSNTQNSPGAGGVSLMRLSSAGNLTVTGSVTATNIANSSDRALKSNFAAVNPRAVLDRLAALPVQAWSYRSEGEAVRHMGPMAQDFKAAFGLGADDKSISTVDAAGVTMAAVQGLYQLSLEKDRKIERLTAEVDELKARLQRLEEAVRGREK